MTRVHAYDAGFEPAAPVIPVRVARPHGGEDGIALPMLVDTGADCTLIPIEVVRRLRLPVVDVVTVTALGGAKVVADVHAAAIDAGGGATVMRIVALANEAILGRDALANLVVVLDGPARRLSVRGGPRRTKARPRKR
ncbi:MAG TPA: aspartyl protease family protein [Kofleriaceae bacterium]|nr:aspartyl protease family protein [Kofleriaceae bacterium]